MDEGIKIIKKYEGLNLKAYPDPATKGAPFTIGFGSTRNEQGKPFKLGDTITKEQAENLLQRDALVIFSQINKNPTLEKLKPECKGALISLCYNIKGGFNSFIKSNCYQGIKNKNISLIFHNWDWGVSQANVSLGLSRRRAEELSLFLNHFNLNY